MKKKKKCFSIKEDINFNYRIFQHLFEGRSSKFAIDINFIRNILFLDNSGIPYPFSSVNFSDIHLIFYNKLYNPLKKELNEKKVSSFR